MAPIPKKRGRKKATSSNGLITFDGTIEDKDILNDVARAAGPQHPPGNSLENPNPHWTNQPQTWSHEFTPRMAAALVKAVNLGTARLADSLGKNVGSYLGDELRESEQLQSEVSQSTDSLRMRLDVLWWSEALYSPSFQVGYRELSLPVAAVATAMDLAVIVPPLAPTSVCYVLGEAVLRVARLLDTNGEQPIIAYLHGLAVAKAEFSPRLPTASTGDARVPLLDLVSEASTGFQISAEILRSRTGIDGALQLSPAEFAMWVFRDLQARRLVEALQ